MDKKNEDAIKQLVNNVDAAFNEGNAVKMASYWTENGLNINPFGDVFEGRANIETDLRESLNGFMKGSKHELSINKIYQVNEQIFVADGITTVTGITGFDGNQMEPLMSNFSMICSKKEDDSWKIIQLRAFTFIPKQ